MNKKDIKKIEECYKDLTDINKLDIETKTISIDNYPKEIKEIHIPIEKNKYQIQLLKKLFPEILEDFRFKQSLIAPITEESLQELTKFAKFIIASEE